MEGTVSKLAIKLKLTGKIKPQLVELINVKSVTTDTFIVDVTKVGSIIFNPEVNIRLYNGSPVKIAMERRGSNKKINTYVGITFGSKKIKEKGYELTGPERLDQFDRIVLDAVTTLMVEGDNHYITTNMIYHTITGDDNKRASPNYIQDVRNSLLKMMFTRISIKASEEAIMYKGLENFEYDSAMLPAEMVTARLNRNEVTCIHTLRVSPLYTYAENKSQICKVDKKNINATFNGKIRGDKEYAILVFYLLRRVIAVKSLSNSILYDTLYKDFGLDNNATSKDKLILRRKVKTIIESWKDHTFGDILITGYEEIKKGYIPHKIVIYFKIIKTSEAKKAIPAYIDEQS